MAATLLQVAFLRSAAFAAELPHPSTSGPNPDFPPFVGEHNGVFDYPWGAANYTWPEQTNVGALATAVWLCGGGALEEYPTTKEASASYRARAYLVIGPC